MKPGALLLLLAAVVAHSPSMARNIGKDADDCLNYYGANFSYIYVIYGADTPAEICVKNNKSESNINCLGFGDIGSTAVEAGYGKPAQSITVNPNINSTSTCSYYVRFLNGSDILFEFTFYNLGAQAAGRILTNTSHTSNVNLTAKFNESTMDSWSFTNAEMQMGEFIDLSGCRVSDVPFAAGSDIRTIPETCSKVICDGSAVVSTVSTCGPTEVCHGNSKCIPLVVCTVTGSTIIDFNGRVHSVQDRCTYNLMRHQDGMAYNLHAGFREQRRKDVSFLDHLIISLPGVKIHLEQDGRVWVGYQAVTLNATAQLFDGVELSKDHTGVTAKLPSSNMTVFFDGKTAHVSGPVESVNGLCGNPINSSLTTTLREEKSSNYSAAGCEIQHNDTVDSTINCNRSTEHCNLTRQAPFAACHEHIDPEPYITACTNTLCNYPPVDGLNCQFFEAYAKACSLKSNIKLKDWRSTAGCPADPQAFCQDQYCSDHEFCGEKKFGDTRCFCRAIFASKYKPRNVLGEPTVCTQSSATVTLAGCLMADKGIDYSILHLNDPNCKGHMDDQTHMVTFSYNSSNICGTEVMKNNSQIIYKNSIMTRNSSMNGVITRNDQVEIDFSCFYTEPDIRSLSFRIKDSSVVEKIVSGVWNYTLMMNAYTDPGHMQLVGPSTEIQLDQKIWLELKTEGLDGNMVAIVTDSCWATSQQSPNDSLRYDLIIKGCPNPADQTVTMEGNGQGTSNAFSFNMFEFSGKSSQIYLHCQVELCPTQGKSCAPSCGGGTRRKRGSTRSKYADGNPGLITMAWSN